MKDLCYPFPDPFFGPKDEPVAWGGVLEPHLLLHAYSLGLFPWYNDPTPILWWSPDPRMVLFPDNFHLPRRSARKLASRPFTLTFNQAFDDVIDGCAQERKDGEGTWILPEIRSAYINLHNLGYAHSVEAWRDGELAGGLYGVALEKAFFGESMFHRESEASRAALSGLVSLLRQNDFLFIDCQQETPHMAGMGARPLERADFLKLLGNAAPRYPYSGKGRLPWRPWLEEYCHDDSENRWILKTESQSGYGRVSSENTKA